MGKIKGKGETEFYLFFDPTDPLTLWSSLLGLFAHLECAIEFWTVFVAYEYNTTPTPQNSQSVYHLRVCFHISRPAPPADTKASI